MKKFTVNVKVPIRVKWKPELVENAENFYMKLTPQVMTGGGDSTPRLTRTQTGGATRYMTTKHFLYNQAIEEAKRKAVEEAKKDKDIKNALIKGAGGTKATPVSTPTPYVQPKPSVLDTIQVSQEDIALGGGIGREKEDNRLLTTGFSEKEIEKFTKDKKE
jgi:hypothetical protein